MSDTLFYSPTIEQDRMLPETESHHCVKVLRKQPGDAITVTDGQGVFYDCSLVDAHPKKCMVQIHGILKQPKSWPIRLHVAFAPTKQMERNEWFVEKATEIGVDKFVPMRCGFSERKDLKQERLNKIMVSAMKQSKQAVLPQLTPISSFEEVILTPFDGRKFIAHCYETDKQPLAQTYRKGENVLVLIGPEGDFTPEEVNQATQNGFESVNLGTNRLRTETACLVALHTIHVINHL